MRASVPEQAARSYRVHRATSDDVARVAPLFDAYRVFYGRPSDLDAARDFLTRRIERDESVVLVASAESAAGPDVAVGAAEEVAGFAQLYRSFSSVSLGPIVILNDLYVEAPHRQAGVGRALVEAAAAYAAREGAIRLELATQRNNVRALGLYHALGFVRDTEFSHLSLELSPRPAPPQAAMRRP